MSTYLKTLSPPVQRALDALKQDGVLFIPTPVPGESSRGTAWLEVPATGAMFTVSFITVDALHERDFIEPNDAFTRPRAAAWTITRRGRRWIDA